MASQTSKGVKDTHTHTHMPYFSHPDEQEEYEYQMFAAYDAKVEAYGDRCPGCGTLRWGGDCPKCYDWDAEAEATERQALLAELATDPAPAVCEGPAEVEEVDDDIPF